jgi:hypothetical protein
MRFALCHRLVLQAALPVVFLSSFLVPTTVHAASLGLTPAPVDIESTFLNVTYSGTALTASGLGNPFTVEMDSSSPATDYNIYFGTFNLTATIDHNGHLGSGEVIITGDLHNDSDVSIGIGTILKGNLTDFSYIFPANPAAGNPEFQFTFDVTDGLFSTNPFLASKFGDKGGIILEVFSPTPNPTSFESSFSDNSGLSAANTFSIPTQAVPLPLGSMSGMLVLGGFVVLRRRVSKPVI